MAALIRTLVHRIECVYVRKIFLRIYQMKVIKALIKATQHHPRLYFGVLCSDDIYIYIYMRMIALFKKSNGSCLEPSLSNLQVM